jgi:geranylgeranyl diphosphate synthase type I
LPRVERDIASRLDAALSRAGAPDARAMVSALRSLALRGGKRLRASFVCAGHAAFGGDPMDVIAAASGVEILHAYLLAHDDWMDADDVRRGGPSVHAELRDRFGDERQGAIGAVLAGDLGGALAVEAVCSVALPAERVVAGVRELAAFHTDVVLGQMLDVRNTASDLASVEAMHELKTASYTVRGPLRLGAALAGARDLQAIDAFANPLGVAFQLQDDVLGAFGDPKLTGKPRGSDLREGKRTSLVAIAMRDRAIAPLLDRVLGVADAPEDEVFALLDQIDKRGVRARVEERVDALLDRAREALAPFAPAARALLSGAVDLLAKRTR